MDNETPYIKPCQHCKATQKDTDIIGKHVDGKFLWWIKCEKCGYSVLGYTLKDATDRWNEVKSCTRIITG